MMTPSGTFSRLTTPVPSLSMVMVWPETKWLRSRLTGWVPVVFKTAPGLSCITVTVPVPVLATVRLPAGLLMWVGPVPLAFKLALGLRPLTVAVPEPLLATLKLPAGLSTVVAPLPVRLSCALSTGAVIVTGAVPPLSIGSLGPVSSVTVTVSACSSLKPAASATLTVTR